MTCRVPAVLLAAAVLASVPLSSRAASMEKVHEFVEVMGLSKVMKDVLPTITAAMVNGLKQGHPNLPPDITEIVTNVVNETISPLVPQMVSSTEKLYADNFTDQEISDAISFYRTPTGQKILQKLPALMQQGAQSGQSLVQAHIPEMQQRLLQELKQRHPELVK